MAEQQTVFTMTWAKCHCGWEGLVPFTWLIHEFHTTARDKFLYIAIYKRPKE